jgi:hypothetical protein
MSGAWTPGPWRVNPKAATNVESANGRGVAACGGYYDNTSNGAYAVENEANAHLIAAAPDLYAALADALKALEKFVDTSAEQRKPYEHPLSAYDRGQDALAKARGETK